MLFNSLTFVVFFVVVVTTYWSIHSWTARKNLLVTASYIFYGAWNPPFAALLFSTTAMDFWLGARMARAKGKRSRRAWLIGSVCMNLSMLGFFKYGTSYFRISSGCSHISTSSISRRTSIFFCQSAFRFTRFTRFPTHWTFIA